MKHILKIALLCVIPIFTACDDFFNVQTDNVLDDKDYISADNEMYAGFIGIMTKVQAIGDKVIYLTDTRGELLEPTVNASSDLLSLYNYTSDLYGNSYANPAAYYDVIIACNDYMAKMHEYNNRHSASIDDDHYKALISSTLRVKAWVYLTIAKIYGEAVWFDDPLLGIQDLSGYEVKNLDQVVNSCKQLLDTGVDGINGKLSFSWVEWLDPTMVGQDGVYRYWDYMTPEYFALYAELCLWSGNYQQAVDLLLTNIQRVLATSNSDATSWLRNITLDGNYKTIWNSINPYARETVSAIIYDYSKNQTNDILRHFDSEAPNEYLLAPSEVGRDRFSDPVFNNLGGRSDTRGGVTFRQNSANQWVIQKFRPIGTTVRTKPYQADVPIYIYRSSELHFMLSEALNQMERYTEAAAIINQGVGGAFPNGNVTWEGFTSDWTAVTATGTRKYPNAGIRGTFLLGDRTFYDSSDPDAKKKNDLALLDEMLLEFPCEGKIYPAMIRIAKRYNDFDMIADRVCPKYSNPEEIRTKIQAGGYFIKWNMKGR